MNIQWYPGHMTKARRMMQENIKLIDLVIELVDARAPMSSRNPDIDDLAKGKARLILLNKSDLASERWNDAWAAAFKAQGFFVVKLDSRARGGMKEVQFTISGQGAYSKMKYESGVHRVQRVPETESGGRIHTSTISVAVMPEVDDDIDIVIEDKDIRIDVMRASGNGGQCVNTTDSAVRLTHYPSGIVVYSQTEKSQIQNKAKAFALLKSKLYDIEQQQRHDAEAEMRRSQIGTGDRSEKIRTYNFPQGRVTDHRIGLTLYKLDKIMNGDIEEIIDACIAADQAAKLAKMNEE